MTSSQRYPIGYGTELVTRSELWRRHGVHLEPEFGRRLFAWLESVEDHSIGIGSSWRSNPHPVSAASRAGKSFHQDQRFANGTVAVAAVDLVARNGRSRHRAPYWGEVPRQGSPEARQTLLHANVRNEPWHLQPIELDGFDRWVAAGRPNPTPHALLAGPGGIFRPAPTPPYDFAGWPRFAPDEGAFGLWPLHPSKPTIRKGSLGDPVLYFQSVAVHRCRLRLDIDGRFGTQSDSAARSIQRWNNLHIDGIVGPKTWKAIDAYALA